MSHESIVNSCDKELLTSGMPWNCRRRICVCHGMSENMRPSLALALALACNTAKPAAPLASAPAPETVVVVPPIAPSASAVAPKKVIVNLLDVVPATLAVSSTVVNKHDFPEHLIDGQPGTAWNSKTGDTRGWIGFRIPEDAHVDAIELTAGFDKVSGKLDLFTANHRITRVAISRNGKRIKEAVVDPNVRGMQAIAVDDAGGDYKVEVTDTLPGTKKEWKELVVSEFRVLGKPGKQKREPNERLHVALKTLEPQDETPYGVQTFESKAPEPSLTKVCDAFLKQAAIELVTANADQDHLRGLVPGKPTCSEIPSPTTFSATADYKSVHALSLYDGIVKSKSLVVETKRGFFLTSVTWNQEDPLDPGCATIARVVTIEELRVDNGYFVAVLGAERGTYRDSTDPNDDGFRMSLVRTAQWGKDDGKSFTTTYWDPQFHEGLGFKIQPKPQHLTVPATQQVIFPAQSPWSALLWKDAPPFRVSPSGVLQPQG
jgi:hypothetical protein